MQTTELSKCRSYPKFDTNFLVITLVKPTAVYPDQLLHKKGISNHGHKVTIIPISGCSFHFGNQNRSKKEQ